MAKYTVRHALLQYMGTNSTGQPSYETAFRNMSVEFSDGPETTRLIELGAIVPDGEELARPGQMLALPETATDEEILNWVAGATTPEVTALVAARPVMAPRLLSAQEAISKRFQEQAELLGQAAKEQPSGDAEQAPVDTLFSGEGELSDEDADKVVSGGARQAADYISENPRHAQAVLAAESRRDEEPRVSVVRAAQAAAAFRQ